MKRIIFLASVIILSCISLSAQTFSFPYGGETRSYIVHLPAGYTPSVQYPLVLNFHGYTSNANQQMLYSGMNAVADVNHFIVVYPDGLNNSWNVGFGFAPYNSGVDDVGFTNALLDTLSAHYSVNPARMYSCGLSNGGYFSYRLACELENRIAAIASVSGTMTDSMMYYCSTSRNVPVMHVHGTTDPIVNYNGGPQTKSVDEVIAYWIADNACATPPVTTPLPNTNTNDNSTVETIWYNSCANGSEVLFYKITDGGHTWPGGAIDIAAYGNTNRDIAASVEIWKFFDRFSVNGPLGVEMQDQPEITVYPNPVSGQLNLQSSGEITRWSVCDISGKLQLQGVSPGKSLSLQSLSPGIYFLRMETAEGIYSTKIIKE